jgi:transposase
MPWKEVTPMEEMIRFVSLVKTDRYTFTEVCEQFGVSRKTGYKHLGRYEEAGMAGLAPRSHRPLTSPQRQGIGRRTLCQLPRRRPARNLRL